MLCALLVAAASVAHSVSVSANTGVVADGVSFYDATGSTNTDCDTEATGFYNTITGSGSPFSAAALHTDNGVADKDFLDPDIAGGDPSDDDTDRFDNTNHAVALVCAHGTCDDVTSTECIEDSSCGTGYCPGSPPTGTLNGPACIANSSRRLFVNSSNSIHGNNAFYAPGNARWGESPSVGDWAGAATNGSDMAVFLINSCAFRSQLVDNLLPAFAGAVLINVIQPTSNIDDGVGGADAETWSDRGTTLAMNALANLSGSVANSWAYTLNAAPSNTAGSGCPNLNNTFTYGGAYGIAGCGANTSVSADKYADYAEEDIADSWDDIRNPALGSLGNEYYQWTAACNYDCSKYGM